MATDIIIYHELSKELETQVIGRAQRIGRIMPLNIFYLYNENEILNNISTCKILNVYNEKLEELETLAIERFCWTGIPFVTEVTQEITDIPLPEYVDLKASDASILHWGQFKLL